MRIEELNIPELSQFCYLQLDENGLLQLTSKSNFTNQVYFIFIDGKLSYIGKTKNFRKRFDTYRNCINWVSCMDQNRKKTQLLTEALLNGQKVEIYFKPAIFNDTFKDFENKDLLVQSLLEEERRLIKKYKPEWNVQNAT